MAGRFAIQQVSIHGTAYPGVRGVQIDPGLQIDSDGSDGTVYETAHHLIQGTPSAEITTLSLKAMLTLLASSTDLPLLTLNGSTGLIMYGAKADTTAPGYLGSGNHLSRTALNGQLWMSGVRWSLGGKAEMTLRAMFTSTDGTTDPVTASVAATLPTAPIPDLAFTLSALTLNGVAIAGVSSIDIECDPKISSQFSAGLPYPTMLVGAGTLGRLSHRLRAEVYDADIGSGTGSVSAVFTQYASGGTLAASTVTFTLNANWSVEEGLNFQIDGPATRTLVVRPRYSGSTKPLTTAST